MEHIYPFKKTARIVAVLFLLATAASMVGFTFVGSVINAPDFPRQVNANKHQLSIGILFHLINDASVVGIGVLMFGILNRYNQNIAIAYAGSRFIEAGILMVGKISLLLLPLVSREFVNAGTYGGAYYQTLGNVGKEWHQWSFEIAMLSVGLGGFFFCYLLYRTKLVPRVISVLGMIGYTLLFARSVLRIAWIPQGYMLFVPVGLFELIFPIWIIVKGFNTSSIMRDTQKSE